MNGIATSGKNFQTPEHGANSKGAYEIGLISPAASHLEQNPLFSSLAPRKRMPSFILAAQLTPRPARNYGNRKFRYRWVDDLKPWQIRMLHEADAVAARLGLPLNMFVTINYHATFAGGAAMASTFKRAMKRMGQWFLDHGLPFAYIYVHENPGDAKPNSHLLVHMPPRLIRAFTAKVSDWFDALDGGVKVEPRNDAQRRAQGKTTRLQYVGKGAPGLACRCYGGHRAKGGQGPIHIKRAGVAQCLQVKAAREFSGIIKRGRGMNQLTATERTSTSDAD